MKLIKKKTITLRKANFNPRFITNIAKKGLKESIKKFGYVKPLIWNKRSNRIVGGNQRLAILKELGIKEIFVIEIDIDEKKEKLLNITLNNEHIQGDWDKKKLGMLLNHLSLDNLDNLSLNNLNLNNLAIDLNIDLNIDLKEIVSLETKIANINSVNFDIDKYDILLVNFSGGRDSLGVLFYCLEYYKNKQIELIYSEIGVEFPDISYYVSNIARKLGLTLHIINPAITWWHWLYEQNKWPDLRFLPCIYEFITKPIINYIKYNELFAFKKILRLTGKNLKQITRIQRDNFNNTKDINHSFKTIEGIDVFFPLLEIDTSVLIAKWLKKTNLNLWKGYSMGFERTACWCCPGQRKKQARALKKHYPHLFDIILDIEKELGVMKPLEARSIRDII